MQNEQCSMQQGLASTRSFLWMESTESVGVLSLYVSEVWSTHTHVSRAEHQKCLFFAGKGITKWTMLV